MHPPKSQFSHHQLCMWKRVQTSKIQDMQHQIIETKYFFLQLMQSPNPKSCFLAISNHPLHRGNTSRMCCATELLVVLMLRLVIQNTQSQGWCALEFILPSPFAWSGQSVRAGHCRYPIWVITNCCPSCGLPGVHWQFTNQGKGFLVLFQLVQSQELRVSPGLFPEHQNFTLFIHLSKEPAFIGYQLQNSSIN